jgi:hypothetical protein
MLFLENIIRLLLIVHAVSAAVLVASSTHHLLWCRGYLAGQFGRFKGERRFALIAACASVITFVLGNLLYPTYKVRVRAEYFDAPSMIVHGLPSVARLFDIKEHWVALGCMASVALFILSRRAHPKDHPHVVRLYFALSMFVCASAWFGALVGLVTASYRSVATLR